MYDKRKDFDFEIVIFLILDGDVSRSTSYGVYTTQLTQLARGSMLLTKILVINC